MCSYVTKNELSSDELRAIKMCMLKSGCNVHKMNQFPQFQKFIPNHYPWHFETKADEQYMLEAFDAALEVSEKLKTQTLKKLHLQETEHLCGKTISLLKKKKDGSYTWKTTLIPEYSDYDYEVAKLYNELAYIKVKKMKAKNMTWACGLIRVPQPFTTEKDNAPVFPLVQLIIDENTGMICSTHMAEDGNVTSFPNVLLDTIETLGKPNKIKMINIRTFALYSDFINDLGIQIPDEEKSVLFNRIKDDLLQHI